MIGTARHESRRIDRQLAGRCARQGDPGYCEFFVSLQDEIIEAYGEKPAIRIRKRYAGRGELTSTSMRCLVLTAQAKKERQHFRDRKLLMAYEKQRADTAQHGPESRARFEPGPSGFAVRSVRRLNPIAT